jgi:predicted transcriptional regulator of viral defense system
MNYELGPLEAELVFTLEREGRTLFTVDNAREILDCSNEILRVVLWRLALKGRIQRVKRGYYLLVPARAGYDTKWSEHVFYFIDGVLDEYYVGYWTALSYWQMTEQIPLTVFIATTKRRRDFTYSDTVPIHFITISPHKFFGWTQESIGDRSFRISDKEKTIIDSLDLPQYAGGILEAAKGLSHQLDWHKIAKYAERLRNGTVQKRLGYLIEVLELNPPTEVMERLRGGISSGYSWLDPTAPKKKIESSANWKLKINFEPEEIRSTIS